MRASKGRGLASRSAAAKPAAGLRLALAMTAFATVAAILAGCARDETVAAAVAARAAVAGDPAADPAARVGALVAAAEAALNQGDADEVEKALAALETAGFLDEARAALEAALLESQAAGRPAPGVQLALGMLYGRLGLKDRAYAAMEAAETAAAAPGVGFSLAAIHGRKGLLAPSGSGAFALSVSCALPGASLSLDGKAPVGLPARLEALRPGRHELSVSLAGYDDLVDVVEGADGASVAYEAVLLPAPVPLSVTTSPAGASVTIDDACVGVSPWSGTVRPGDLVIVARLEGYEDASANLLVGLSSAGNEASLELRPKRAAAAPAAAKPAAKPGASLNVVRRTMTVDGLVDDWAGIPPACVDARGDDRSGAEPGTDISAVYLSSDERYLYLRVDLADGSRRDTAAESSDYTVYLVGDPQPGGGNMAIDLNVYFETGAKRWSCFMTRYLWKGGKAGKSTKLTTDFTFKLGASSIEMRVPFNVIRKYFSGGGPYGVWADYSVWNKVDATLDSTPTASFTLGG